MYTLFYSPGSMSLAAHIALLDAGVHFDKRAFSTASDANLDDEYRAINPTTLLPALQLPDGEILTENIAIFVHLVDVAENKKDGPALWPSDRRLQLRALERLSFVASAVHPPFALYFRTKRWGFSKSVSDDVKRVGKERFLQMLAHLDWTHRGAFALGEYSVVDAQQFVVTLWSQRMGVSLADFPKLMEWMPRMLARPNVQRALADEGLLKKHPQLAVPSSSA